MGHNPSGTVISVQRRREIYAICQKFDVIIIEDDPYWCLQFASAAEREAESRGTVAKWAIPYHPPKSSGFEFLDSLIPSFLSMDVDGRVIRLDTFSKTVAPGCRLGWITAQPAFIERLERYGAKLIIICSTSSFELITEFSFFSSLELRRQPLSSPPVSCRPWLLSCSWVHLKKGLWALFNG